MNEVYATVEVPGICGQYSVTKVNLFCAIQIHSTGRGRWGYPARECHLPPGERRRRQIAQNHFGNSVITWIIHDLRHGFPRDEGKKGALFCTLIPQWEIGNAIRGLIHSALLLITEGAISSYCFYPWNQSWWTRGMANGEHIRYW